MLKRIILYGHTGSMNRGCDAIVKSTADLLHRADPRAEVLLVTNRKSEDQLFGFDEFDSVVEAAGFENAPVRRCLMLLIKLLFKKNFPAYAVKYTSLNRYLKDSLVVVVGGDTYCYGYSVNPQYSYIVDVCSRRHLPCVLWACSVEADRLVLPQFRDHFGKYDMIFPREQETLQGFLQAGYDSSRLYKMSDPAFTLKPAREGIRPADIPEKPAVGMNLSSVTLNWSNDRPLLLRNVSAVVEYILRETDMDVLLIPHVYPAKQDGPVMSRLYGTKRVQSDIDVLRPILEQFPDEPRLRLIDGPYNSKQLKYIISRCRLVVTARTHVSIAAYSAGVPTIVIGYSIKAFGLAEDLFGTSENFVVDNTKILDGEEILRALQYVLAHYDEVKSRLAQAVLVSQKEAENAARFLMKRYAG